MLATVSRGLAALGDDCVPAYFAIGVQAYTSSISNIAPTLSLQLAEAGSDAGFRRLDGLMRRYVHPLYAIRDRRRGYEVAVMKAGHGDSRNARRSRASAAVRLPAQDVEDIRKLMDVYQEVLEERESGQSAERSPAGAGRIFR